MIFKLASDAVFEAENYNDALVKLRNFFGRASRGKTPHLKMQGKIDLQIGEIIKEDPSVLKVNVSEVAGVGDKFGK